MEILETGLDYTLLFSKLDRLDLLLQAIFVLGIVVSSIWLVKNLCMLFYSYLHNFFL